MSQTFADALCQSMLANGDIWLITCDSGYDLFKDFPVDRALNVGIAHQTALDIAVGLAHEGKTPFVFGETSFLLLRGLETIRTYISYETIPVKIVGLGRNGDFKRFGYSYHSPDAKSLLDVAAPLVISSWPERVAEIPGTLDRIIHNGQPSFLSLEL